MYSHAPQNRRPDWSSLPADAMEFISSLIADDVDYVRFRSVCSSWRSAAPKRPLLPWLLVFSYNAHPISAALYNFPNSNFFPTPSLQDDMFQGKIICGSSHGWIAVLDRSQSISLHNPFIAVQIDLPSLADLPWINKSDRLHRFPFYRFAEKLVLSSDPRIPSCIALAFSDNHNTLIYCHPGEGIGSWTALPPFIDNQSMLDDIIFYQGKFFVVQAFRVFVCDILSHEIHVNEISPTNPLFSDSNLHDTFFCWKTSHLVESYGDLLLVTVSYPHQECGVLGCDKYSFKVFQVHLDFTETPNGRLSLFKLDNLGGRNLFLGCDTLSFSVINSPHCKGNCIFFLSDMDASGGSGVIVFSMEDDTVSSVAGFSHDSPFSTMHWLTPSLC